MTTRNDDDLSREAGHDKTAPAKPAEKELTDEEKIELGWILPHVRPEGDAWDNPVWSD